MVLLKLIGKGMILAHTHKGTSLLLGWLVLGGLQHSAVLTELLSFNPLASGDGYT
jgi:hypothetical protein